jgi:hypothetical protein
MPTDLILHAHANELRTFVPRMPARAGHWGKVVANLNHLVAYAGAQPVCAQLVPGLESNHSIFVAYRKGPGATALYIAVELRPEAEESTDLVTVAPTSGTIAWLGQGAGQYAPFDGTDPSQARLRSTTVVRGGEQGGHAIYEAVMDVSALTAGTIYDLEVAFEGSGDGGGFYRLHVLEVPLGSVAPEADPTTEAGIQGARYGAGVRIDEGSAATAWGTRRLLKTLDDARRRFYRHWQIVCPEAVGGPVMAVSSTAFLPLLYPTGADDPTWLLRARYATATSGTPDPDRFIVRVRYAADVETTLRCIVTPVGGSPVNTDLVLAANGYAFGVGTGTLNLPVTGVAQECELRFEAKHTITAGATPTQISAIALLGNPT